MSDTAGIRREAGSPDGAAIDRLLLEAGMDDDGGLRPVLQELQSLAGCPPVPSDAVAGLMLPGTPAAAADADPPAAPPAAPPADELAARRRARRRLTLTTLSVAVSLAAGGAVAAASDHGVRDSFGRLNHAITSLVAGPGAASSDASGQTPAPGPAEPARTTPAPVPVPATPPGGTPEPDANGRKAIPGPVSPTAVPPSGAVLPGSLPPGVPGNPLDKGYLGEGSLHDGAPGLPGQPPLPLPVAPPLSPAAGS